MPAAPGKKHYASALEALREAEALANLPPKLSGVDDPPEAGKENAWVSDWTDRAKAALKKVWSWTEPAAQPVQHAAKKRAAEVARKIQSGARAIRAAGAKLADNTAEKLRAVTDAAGKLQWLTFWGGGLMTVVLVYLAYKMFFERK